MVERIKQKHTTNTFKVNDRKASHPNGIKNIQMPGWHLCMYECVYIYNSYVYVYIYIHTSVLHYFDLKCCFKNELHLVKGFLPSVFPQRSSNPIHRSERRVLQPSLNTKSWTPKSNQFWMDGKMAMVCELGCFSFFVRFATWKNSGGWFFLSGIFFFKPLTQDSPVAWLPTKNSAPHVRGILNHDLESSNWGFPRIVVPQNGWFIF